MSNKEFQVRHGLIVNGSINVSSQVFMGSMNLAHEMVMMNTYTQTVATQGSNTSGVVFDHSNNVYAAVNSAFGVINAAYGNANSIAVSANNYAGAMANSGNAITYTVVSANLDTARAYTNTSTTAANNYAGAMANSVNVYTSQTYIKINEPSGQTITGNVSIVGSLNISGNTSYIQVDNYRVDDPLIYIAGNNYTSDIVDIGFIANYVNTGGANVHTGLYREHVDKEWYLFQGYDTEPRNNHIGALSNNMTLAVLNADVRTSNLNLGGANAIVWIKTAFDTVNAAFASANNVAPQIAPAFNTANAAFGAANSKVASVSGTSGRITSSGGTTPAIDLASGVVTPTSATGGISALTVDTYGRVTAVTGSAGYVTSSGVTSVAAGTGLSGGTITSTGTISMPNVGPGAGSYSSGISALTLDAQGRVTAITGSAGYITSSALSSYLPLAGGAMTGNITYLANSGNGINFNGTDTTMHRIYLDGFWTIFKSHANEGWQFRDNSNNIRARIYGNSGRIDAPSLYDSNDTGYYVDPNADRSTNINGFSARTVEGTKGTAKYNIPRFIHTGDTNYWVGTMGWGTTDWNSVFDWGSGFVDSWSSPANRPPSSGHHVGMQTMHYTNGSNRYGFQIAGGTTSNFYYRNIWGSVFSPWRTVVSMGVNENNTGGLYADIMYDSNDTYYYNDLNSSRRFAGRTYIHEWIEFVNFTALYSPNNNAHFYPNNASYGAWRIDGARNGWQGIEFAGQTTLMMNDDSYGFHRNTGGDWRFYVTGSTLYVKGNVVAYWSDRRLKENLRPIGKEATDILSRLTAYRFNWNDKVDQFMTDLKPGKEEIGLIAQEVREVLPDAIIVNKCGNKIDNNGNEVESEYLTISWNKITPLVVQALNDTTRELNELKQLLKDKGVL